MASWQGFGLGLLAGLTFSCNHAIAQITPDNTLGAESSIVTPVDPLNALVGGGAVRDANLFHSFQDFNVGEGRGAYFANPVGIENIFSRVTGGNPSNIFGVLGVLGEANLFLLNPNGVLFGENASLDLQGSFFVSTANAIRFGDEGFFSATQPETPQILTVNPDAFFFSMVAAQQNNAIENRGFLFVPEGESLVFLGGNVAPDAVSTGGILIDGGTLFTPGGRVEIAGVGEVGSVGIEESNGSFGLSFPQDLARTDVSLSGGIVYTVGGGGGSIAVYADDLTLGSKLADNAIELERSFLLAGIGQGLGSVDAQAGDITVDATGVMVVSGGNIVNLIFPGAIGKAGDINLRAESLSLTNGSQIGTSLLGQGTGGNLTVDVSESIEVIGSSADIQFASGMFVNVSPEAIGKGGNLTIETENLLVAEGAEVSASTLGEGDAGNLTVRAIESVIVSGTNPINGYSSNLTTQVNSRGEGKGGNLTIETGQLLVERGAQVEASTFGTGDAGDLIVTAQDIQIIGTSELDSTVPSGLGTDVGSEATGEGGNLTIETETLLVSGGAQISASTNGKGDAGNLTVRATESVIVSGTDPVDGSGGLLTTQVDLEGEGNAGDLTIETSQLLVERGGRVQASTLGRGDAGDLIVTAQDIQLIGFSPYDGSAGGLGSLVNPEAIGKGGDVTIETETLLVAEGAVIAAGTFGNGDAGNLTIRATESIIVSGTNPIEGSGSGLSVRADSDSTGNAGDLTITSGKLLLEDNALITAQSAGTGDAGNITITTNGLLSATDSDIRTNTTQSSGGAINITAEKIRLYGDSDIKTDVSDGAGGGGNINLTADSVIAFNDSDILAFAQDGRGGDINFNTPAFFGENFRPAPKNTDPETLDLNDRVDVNASGAISGEINTPDVSFIVNSLIPPRESLIDTEEILANSCIVRSQLEQPESTFFIIGKGGLPERPGDLQTSVFPLGTIRNLPSNSEDKKSSEWQEGDPIIEPQGVYRLPNGELVLSRECHQ